MKGVPAMLQPRYPQAPGGGRVRGVDAARGIALIGMVATHVYPAVEDDGAATPAHLLASGRASAAFAVLAGVALALSTGRLPAPQARASTVARAACIGTIGLALGYTHSGIAVILCYYALMFILAVPLLRAPLGALVVVTVLAFAVVPAAGLLSRDHLPSPTLDDPTFGRVFTHPVSLTLEMGFTGFYPALAWLGYLCVGLAAGRLDLRSTRVAAALLAEGGTIAAAASLASWALLRHAAGMAALESVDPVEVAGVGPLPVRSILDAGLYGSTPTNTWWWLAVDTPHSSTPVDLLHTSATAVALLGFVLLLSRLLPPLMLVPLIARRIDDADPLLRPRDRDVRVLPPRGPDAVLPAPGGRGPDRRHRLAGERDARTGRGGRRRGHPAARLAR
ncbi:heparan-alpha-glucosaminide N-acetyltransferase domain-containing protein [Frankia sp. CcWB3]